MRKKHFNPTNTSLVSVGKPNPHQKSSNIEEIPKGKLLLLWTELCLAYQDYLKGVEYDEYENDYTYEDNNVLRVRAWSAAVRDFERDASHIIRQYCLQHQFFLNPDGISVVTVRTRFGGGSVLVFSFDDPLSLKIEAHR